MKYIPILFSKSMVQAIIEGKKTQTRRIIKQQPDDECYYEVEYEHRKGNFGVVYNYNQGDANPFVRCPYGYYGDILWVKESHYAFGRWIKNGKTKTGKQKWKFVRDLSVPNIRFDDNKPYIIKAPKDRRLGWYKRSALFMEKKDARFFLMCINTRVERLHDISELDSISEGIRSRVTGVRPYELIYQKPDCPNYYHTAKQAFSSLWQSINGPESWDANPMVWVIHFFRLNGINFTNNK